MPKLKDAFELDKLPVPDEPPHSFSPSETEQTSFLEYCSDRLRKDTEALLDEAFERAGDKTSAEEEQMIELSVTLRDLVLDGDTYSSKTVIETLGMMIPNFEVEGFMLHLGVLSENERMVELLLEKAGRSRGKMAAFRDKTGKTAMHLAMALNQKAVLRMLMTAGASIAVTDDVFATPRDYAVLLGHFYKAPLPEEVVAGFVDMDADVSTRTVCDLSVARIEQIMNEHTKEGEVAVKYFRSEDALCSYDYIAYLMFCTKPFPATCTDHTAEYDTQLRTLREETAKNTRRLVVARVSETVGYGLFAGADGFVREHIITVYGGRIRLPRTPSAYEIGDEKVCPFKIDGQHWRSLAAFMNHSVNPNCYAEAVLHRGRLCVFIKAIRDIPPGEQLCLDYGKEWFSERKIKPATPDFLSHHYADGQFPRFLEIV